MKSSIIRACGTLLFTVLFCTGLFGQNQKNYNLLWRISGKGMPKPSYLFGTMHVRDARAFHFSDSVMTAILKCDAFALEVHPDTLVQQMFTELGKKDTSRNMRKLLNAADYERLAKRFKAQNGYEMDNVDPMLVESSLTSESKRPTDKATFVDAYLLAIARTNARKVYGLEKASDQFNSLYGNKDDLKGRLLNLLETEDQDIQDGTNRMVLLYQTGNIDAIWAYLLENDADQAEDMLPRNQVMVASIVKQMASQNLFSAVGVAHLPGPGGVINLLRKQGYTVEAVPATFTGVADRYKVDYMKMPWLAYTDTDKGYSVDMPGKPVKSNLFNGLNTVVYADLSNGVFYGSYAFPRGSAAHPVKTEDVINQLVANYKKDAQAQVISRKAVTINGIPGTELIVKNATGRMRANFIVKNNMLYCLYIGNDEKSLYQPFANRFFNSFKCFPVAPKAPPSWIDYTNADAAFKIKLPLQPTPIEKETPNTLAKDGPAVKLHLLLATDTVSGVNYVLRYNDYPFGSYIADKDAFFGTLETEFSGKGKLLTKPKTIWKGDVEGREIKLMLMDKYFTTVRIYTRGNRIYLLMRQNLWEGVKQDTEDAFFDSFSLLPFKEGTSYAFQPDGENFKIQLPAKPIIKPDTVASNSFLGRSTLSYVSNPNSGGLYNFEYSQIRPYYRAVSVDSLYTLTLQTLRSEADSVIKQDTVTIAGKKGISYIMLKKGTLDKARHALLIDNDRIFYWGLRAANDELDSPVSNDFFNSLQYLIAPVPVDITTSKAERIKADLSSADTTIQKAAMGALQYYDFNKTELPAVYEMLKQSYPDDSVSYSNTRHRLLKVLKTVNDEHAGEFLEQLYADAAGKDEVQADILNTLPKADAKEGYERYLKLLTGKAINPQNKYQMFSPLTDSLSVFAANFKRLLPLVNNLNYRNNLVSLANNLCTSDSADIYIPLVKAALPALTAYAQHDLTAYLNNKDTSAKAPVYPIYNYLKLLQKIKGQALTPGFTETLMKKGDKTELWVDAAVTRIYNHLPVALPAQTRLLDSLDTRYEMLNAYYDEKLMRLVPAKYTRPDEFARLCFYKYVYDYEDIAPEKVRLLGSIADKGKTYYAFKFSLPVEEGETQKTYIGLSGPYLLGKSALNFKTYLSFTNYDVLKTNWQLQARKLLPQLLEANKN